MLKSQLVLSFLHLSDRETEPQIREWARTLEDQHRGELTSGISCPLEDHTCVMSRKMLLVIVFRSPEAIMRMV